MLQDTENYPYPQLLFAMIKQYEREFNLPVRSCNYEGKKTIHKKEKISAEGENDKNENFSLKVKANDVNKLVNKITEGELKLSHPANICCSQVFYLGFPITHSGLSESPFLIMNKEESEKRKLIERNICALLNEWRGGVVLMGCEIKHYKDKVILK